MPDPKELFGYTVLARLGEGAASQIYSARSKSGKMVALKHVVKRTEKDQRFIQQVEQEYEIGSKFDHPNLRAVGRLHRKRKLFKTVEIGLTMEMVDAPGLDINRLGSIRQCVWVFHDIAEGLNHMHQKGYVHADMKPTNVLVQDQMVKVIDLGQACEIGTVKPRIQGTPGYIAPEQAHRRKITPQTDIYNFGATMYWVLLGKVIPTALPPVNAGGGIGSGVIEADRIPLPKPAHEVNSHIPEALSELIMECVRVPRKARPDSMGFVASRLQILGEELDRIYT